MATPREIPSQSRKLLRLRALHYWSTLIILSVLSSMLCASPSARAQFQQPYVFAGGGVVFTRNDQTGVLTSVPGSPFSATHDPSAIDVQGRFLFGVGPNSIRMFTVNASTGSYIEVPNSPFASLNTNSPIFLAVEKTGQYLAVVNAVGQNPGEGSVETFKIDPVNLALTPVPGSFVEMESKPVGEARDPANSRFFLYLGPNPASSNTFYRQDAALLKIAIDPQTGLLSGAAPTAGSTQHGRCFAADPQGRYVLTGFGSNFGFLQSFGIDGKFTGSIVQLPAGLFPQDLFIDSTGTFVYATTLVGSQSVVHIYSVNLQTGAMAETLGSPLPNFTSTMNLIADPTGPFIYLENSPIRGFSVDPLTGYFTEIAGSPFSPAGDAALLFSVPPGGQPITGPVATLSASALSFGSINVASTSGPQTITLTSAGGEALSVNTISISGADASEFLETDACQTPTVLQPGKFCSISVTFTPSATGPQQAVLLVTDNAPGSPHPVQLGGTGVTPPPPPPQKPAVTLTPRNPTFSTITQGTTSSQSVTLKNTGTATLNISSVVLGGNNQNDFSVSNNCSGAFPVNAGCTLSLTFAPLAAGERTMTITLNDDAPDSPQIINVSGNANPAFAVVPAQNGSTSATVSAGQSAQYNLQVAPGVGYTGSISFTCTGVPFGATCQVPSTLQLSNGNPAPLSVTVTTSGSAALFPFLNAPRLTPLGGVRSLPMLALIMIFLAWLVRKTDRRTTAHTKGFAFGTAFAAITLLALFSTAGCGGGSTATVPPPPIVTPQGTSTLTITPTAMSTTGKPLQLQPIQLTLTVK